MSGCFRAGLACLGVAALGTAGLFGAASEQTSAPWPAFRGAAAAGVAVDQDLPAAWNATTGEQVRWKVRVPGLAHSSPITWGDRVFVTTAVSSQGDSTFKPGLYGDGTASEDRSRHQFVVLAYDRRTGKPLWERVAYEGPPIDKRHIKSTYASATPATDGRIVVASFGSQGVFAYDVQGKLLWKRDLGRMDLGAYNLPVLRMGAGELADHLAGPRLRASRYVGRGLHHGAGPRDGEDAVADAASGAAVMVHTDDRRVERAA